jgi:hypothetical protein
MPEGECWCSYQGNPFQLCALSAGAAVLQIATAQALLDYSEEISLSDLRTSLQECLTKKAGSPAPER